MKSSRIFYCHFLFILSFLLIGTDIAFSQSADAYSKQISVDRIRKHLDVLCSDSLEGRETGRPGQKRAASYIAQRFEDLGLEKFQSNSWKHPHPLSLTVNKGKNLEVRQQFFLFGEDFVYAAGGPDTLLVLDSLLFTGYGIQQENFNELKGLNIRNKAVLILEGKPSFIQATDPNFENEKIRRIISSHPRLILVATPDLKKFRDPILGTGLYSSSLVSRETPIIYISMELAQQFLPEAEEYRLEQMISSIRRKKRPAGFRIPTDAVVPLVSNTSVLSGENVAACIHGTSFPEEYVFITAHYDHLGYKDSLICRGADDNASGTSGLLEMASAFKQAARDGYPPRRTIVFMTVSGEEKGLLGSSWFVENLSIDPENIVADINTDMIGRTDLRYDSLGDKNYIYIIGAGKISSELFRINEQMNDSFVGLHLDYFYDSEDEPSRFYYRSDHFNFAKNGIPVIFYFNGLHKDYHTPGDTPEKIDPELLRTRTRLAFLTAWEIANRKLKLKRDVRPR